MKNLLIGLSLLASISSYAICEKGAKAKVLIENFEDYNVVIKQKFVQKDILEAKELLEKGEFCSDMFASLSLCTSLTTEHAYFGGLKAEDESNQYSLEKSLYEYASLFNVPTKNSFGCSLIELDFPALDD